MATELAGEAIIAAEENIVENDPPAESEENAEGGASAESSPKRLKPSDELVAEEENEGNSLKLVIKSVKEQFSVEIGKDSTISELKEVVSKRSKIEEERIFFVFEGKILLEDEVLSTEGIDDGTTIHLIVKSKVDASTPFSMFGGFPGFGSPSVDNILDLQERMQADLLQHPEHLRQLLQDPFVHSMMENPDYIKQIVEASPDMQEALKRNPELRHTLSDPETLRSTLEVARDPALLQHLIDSSTEVQAKSEAESSDMQNTGKKAGVENVLEHMMVNPNLVRDLFNAPYMDSMMEALGNNPQLASQVMLNNPVFGGDASAKEQMKQFLPLFIRQMRDPEVQRLLSDPRAVSAMLSIHQGLEQLQQVAPAALFPGQTPAGVPRSKASPGGSAELPDGFSSFLRNMVHAMAKGSHDGSLPPEERYQSQLEQMRLMGFQDTKANLNALISTFGDVNSAVERITFLAT